jgi:predicted TIM-barrel fold metal-dependent hydrolase
MPVFNSHIHVFSSKCAPERFLDVALPEWMDPLVGPLKSMLETSVGQKMVKNLVGRWIIGRYAPMIDRYIAFINIGLNANQHDVFEHILHNCSYNPDTRFIILTLNMDHMGAGVSEMVFEGQVKEVARLRAKYPSQVLPFLGMDARAGTANLSKLIADNIFVDQATGETGAFIGLKFYPALGYFPFDQRLAPAYEAAREYELPMMTHCTKTGSYYVGKRTLQMTQVPTFDAVNPVTGILEKPDYKTEFSIKIKGNDMDESAVFGQPRAWRFVLGHKPEWNNLKICFAHMGGSNEFFSGKPNNWLSQILGMMCFYPKTYTDISYILSYQYKKKNYKFYTSLLSLLDGSYFKDSANKITHPWTGADISVAEAVKDPKMQYWSTIPERILFGTDFYMTEQEGSESDYAHSLSDWLTKEKGRQDLWVRISETNPTAYLKSKVY